MSKRLTTALRDQNPTVPSIAGALESTIPPRRVMPCLYPYCRRRGEIEWADGRGRPRNFCSDTCRVAYGQDRAQLRSSISLVHDALATHGGTYRERRAVAARLQHLRWLAQWFDCGEPASPELDAN